MQVKPVKTDKTTKCRPLPTAAEVAANPELVAPAPPRAPSGIGSALGVGFLGALLAQLAEGVEPAIQPPPAAALDDERAASDADAAAKAEAARQSVATLVAPMLQKALDEDGRGAFGCVAVDPPAFLSENEALNLIEQEFAKAGVKLRDCYELTGFTRRLTDWDAMRDFENARKDRKARKMMMVKKRERPRLTLGFFSLKRSFSSKKRTSGQRI